MENKDRALQDAMRFAQSAAGQQLIQMLRSSNNPSVNQAIALAAAGNYQQAIALLQPFLNDPNVKKITDQYGGSHGRSGK